MVKDVIYGINENEKYFVQTCCDTEHYGNLCDCVSYGENLSERKAKRIAMKLSKRFNVEFKKV